MPTPEQQREHYRLSDLLQQICVRHRQELPNGTTSVLLTNVGAKAADRVRIEAYGSDGKLIGTVPNERTSPGFLDDLMESFARVKSPDPDGIIAPI